MERPVGPPLGSATQSSGRSGIENVASARAPSSAAARKLTLNSSSRPLLPATNAAIQSEISSMPITSGQVVTLASKAMKVALQENETKAAETSGVSNDLKPGVTIDLSHKNIQQFPDEVVDIIKNELERLALSHNQLSSFPSRFSECTSLRYLNVRSNFIKDFPSCICELTSLEILDLGRNKLRILPPELANLTSLKVLSVQKNRIEVLPSCLADMTSLQVLKLDGNPVKYPPKEILLPQAATSPQNGGILVESEITDVAVTLQIKRFLKQKILSGRVETESGGDESSEGTETPRPMKRAMSGRFPIKVNGTEMPDLRSPAQPRPPPIPSRSHYRGMSQQNTAGRRPGVLPLTITNQNNNERSRSNSESVLQATRGSGSSGSDRSDKSRRMGIVTRKPPELTTVDESRVNRYSLHYRGLSHGSAMQSNNHGQNSSIVSTSLTSPADSSQRATYVRRLSSLPERKRESSSPDPFIEGAKGVLFALYRIHPLIQVLIALTRDGSDKRTSLEAVFYNASSHVDELDRDLDAYTTFSEDDDEAFPRSSENVQNACLTCVSAYIHVCSILSRYADTLIQNGDPRYIRALLLDIYGATVEIRNAQTSLLPDQPSQVNGNALSYGDTLRPQRAIQGSPTKSTSDVSLRSRSVTALQNNAPLRVATNVLAPYSTSRLGQMVGSVSAIPRSGESLASSNQRTTANGDFAEDDRQFENIFLSLTDCTDQAMRTLPNVNSHFKSLMKMAMRQGNTEHSRQYWQVLNQKCSLALQSAEILKSRLSQIKLKEPGVRTQATFWELCNDFFTAYLVLATKTKEARAGTKALPQEVVELLRPLQRIIQRTSKLIENSPWSLLATAQQHQNASNGNVYSVQTPSGQMSVPMTPASAALGPAVQATVPSTPQSSVSADPMFSRNFFDRADAFLSSVHGNHSSASSRSGTMTSAIMGSDTGLVTPVATLSPMSSMTNLARMAQNGAMR